MNKTTRILLFLNFLMMTLSPLWAEVSAVIVNMKGDVMISRRGVFLDKTEINSGTMLEPHDILQTGNGAYAEISIDTPVTPELSVKVMEDTTLFLEHTLKKQNPETSLVLHRGGVESRIAALTEGATFNVRTNSSVMGVKGTSFSVSTAADTSILVSCLEGKVICTTNNEDSYIQAGKVYETDPNGQYSLKKIPASQVQNFTEDWKAARVESLRVNGNVSLENYANLYLQTAPGFLESWSELSSKQRIFKEWEVIIEEGRTMSMGEATKDKITLSNGIIRLRSRLPLMEHVFYTLYDLTRIMDEAEESEQELSDTAERTLLIYHKRQDEFLEKLTQARYYYRIFLEIDKQSSGHSLIPSSDLMEGFMMDDSFFITPPAPGQ
jgi:FecR protein